MNTQNTEESDTTQSVASGKRRKRRKRWQRAVLALSVAFAFSFGIAEAAFRYALFGESETALKLGKNLRKPQLYCDPNSDVDFFKLKHIWTGRGRDLAFASQDPKLGWLSASIKVPGYGHKLAENIRQRRPFLMYGDSFTACVTGHEDKWQELIKQTAFGAELWTINYGTCAYGLGQINLLLEESIEQWVPSKPIVAVGIFVDNDLDRTIFDFRGCPKPLYSVDAGKLSVTLPGEFEIDEWVEQNPVTITSYLLRYMVHHKHWLPASWEPPCANSPSKVEQKKKLSIALIKNIRSELESRDIEYFFILFYGPQATLEPCISGWRSPFLIKTLDSLEIPWVSSRLAMLHSYSTNGLKPDESLVDKYFIPSGKNFGGHFNSDGNKAALPGIMRGLKGLYEGAVKQRATSVQTPLPPEAQWAKKPANGKQKRPQQERSKR